jgi:hypothetical protein
MELSISSLNNIQLFVENDANGLKKGQKALKKMTKSQETTEDQQKRNG